MPQKIPQIKRLTHRTHNYYVEPYYKRVYHVGDLVTIAPEFRYDLGDNQHSYIGIVVEAIKENNEYVIHWTTSPGDGYSSTNHHRGLWNGAHLIKIEDYEKARDCHGVKA